MLAWRPLKAVAVFMAVIAGGQTQDSVPKPYHDARRTPLSYNGPGRDDPDPKDVKDIRIAYFGPADASQVDGGQMWQGASLAIEEANREGGYRGLPFRLIPAWTENPWAGGVASLVRVIYNDKVWAIIGGIDGATTHLAEQVVAKALITLVNPAATDRSIHTAGVPWVFSCAPGDHLQAALISRALKDRGTPFALLSEIDHDSRAFVSQLNLSFSRDRISPVLHVEWDGRPAEMNRVAGQMAAAARVLVIIAGAHNCAALVNAVREAGFTGVVYGGPWIARAGSDGSLNGVLYPVLGEVPDTFKKKFLGHYGREPDYTAAHAYDATNIVITAIRQAGLNRVRIRDAVQALSPIPGVTGTIEWDATGQNQRAVMLRVFGTSMPPITSGSN